MQAEGRGRGRALPLINAFYLWAVGWRGSTSAERERQVRPSVGAEENDVSKQVIHGQGRNKIAVVSRLPWHSTCVIYYIIIILLKEY